MYTPPVPKPVLLTVSQLTTYLKSILENDPRLSAVLLTGEISNLRPSSAGHVYFTLKDRDAVIPAAMFRGFASRLRFRPEEGMKVICRGRVELYAPHGRYQLIVEDMQPDGAGALNLAFEQLKKELEAKGYFAPSHKKPIPKYPSVIGVVTSPTGAAVQDIRNILSRRFPCAEVLLCPVAVQGNEAAPQLTQAVRTLDRYGLCDVIIIGRGGGSIEDLWAFNDRALAEAVFDCRIPVISAVGHETDFTICDFVADFRAPTPSAAAELAVPDAGELLHGYRVLLSHLQSRMQQRLHAYENALLALSGRMDKRSPENVLKLRQSALMHQAVTLQSTMERRISACDSLLKAQAARLEGLNPLAVLSRGYTITEKEGAAVSSARSLAPGDTVTLRFADGFAAASITETGE